MSGDLKGVAVIAILTGTEELMGGEKKISRCIRCRKTKTCQLILIDIFNVRSSRMCERCIKKHLAQPIGDGLSSGSTWL